MTYADYTSLVRMIFGPPFAFILGLQLLYPGKYPTLEEHWPPIAMLVLFLALSLTDLLDGRLAEKFGKTRFGDFLDPLTDKIFIWSYSAAFVFTVAWNAIPILAFLFLLDVVSTAERAIKYDCPEKEMEANLSGKKKTVCHFAAIGCFMLALVFYPESAKSDVAFWSVWPSNLGWVLLWTASWFSGCSIWEKLERRRK